MYISTFTYYAHVLFLQYANLHSHVYNNIIIINNVVARQTEILHCFSDIHVVLRNVINYLSEVFTKRPHRESSLRNLIFAPKIGTGWKIILI